MQVWKCCMLLAENTGHKKITICTPSHTTLLCYIFATKARIDNRKKNLLSSNISSRCPHNMVNFCPIATEIGSGVWGTPANFNGFASCLFCRLGVILCDRMQIFWQVDHTIWIVRGIQSPFWQYIRTRWPRSLAQQRQTLYTAGIYKNTAGRMFYYGPRIWASETRQSTRAARARINSRRFEDRPSYRRIAWSIPDNFPPSREISLANAAPDPSPVEPKNTGPECDGPDRTWGWWTGKWRHEINDVIAAEKCGRARCINLS